MMTIIEQISALELVKVRFRLQFLESFHFEPEMILHWRKELVRAARSIYEVDNEVGAALMELLDPQPAADPVAQKRFQKPAPLFIIEPEALKPEDYTAGDSFSFNVVFPGEGVRSARSFTRLLSCLGSTGLHKNEGRFAVESLEALTHNDGWQPVWKPNDSLEDMALPILNARWLIDDNSFSGQSLILRFITPARLLKRKRPLFAADFSDIFPFILRRVTSILYTCCRVELQTEVSSLITDAASVRSQKNELNWVDWRHLDASHGVQGIGGISGAIELNDGLTDDLHTIIRLAEMFHVGKWASYGAGCFVVEPVTLETIEKR